MSYRGLLECTIHSLILQSKQHFLSVFLQFLKLCCLAASLSSTRNSIAIFPFSYVQWWLIAGEECKMKLAVVLIMMKVKQFADT